jgi:hypothetical protein
MTFLRSIRLGLAAKLAVAVIVSTAAFFTLFGFVNLRVERRQSEGLMVQAADRVADIILRSTRYDMMRHDRDALHNVLQEVGSEPGIQRIRIFNRDGHIMFSTEAREIDTTVDKSAEACYGCHAQSQPLTKLNRPDRARPFWDKQGHHLIAVIRPITNAPECSSAACHVHDAGQRVLGVVDAQLSLAPVDAQIAQNQASLGWFLLGGIVLGSGLAVAFIWIVVYQPVKELIDGTHRVARGRFELPAAGALGRRTGRPGHGVQ